MYKILKQILFVSIGLLFSITSSFADGNRILKFGKHLDFGTVSVGNSATRELTLYNKGDSDLTILSLRFHENIRDLFTGNWSGIIPANGEQNVTITFTPISNTPVSGLVYVESDRTNSGDRSRSLKGLGNNESLENTRILRLGKHLNFSDVVVGSSSVKQLTIYNDGNSVLNITKIGFHEKVNDVYTASWRGSIPANGSKLIDITFKPTDTKTYNGLLYIESDKSNKVDRSRLLRGVGISNFGNQAPTIYLNGDSIVTIIKGLPYVDTGAVANDVEDGNITANITVAGTVNSNLLGEYNLTYSIVDLGGLQAEVSRVVRVINPNILTKEELLVPANCLGKIIKSGEDVNGNGVLDAGEITSTVENYDEGTPITREALMTMIGNGDDVTQVNTCKIVDMSHLFDLYSYPAGQVETVKRFNQNISGWNTGSVIDMSFMFEHASDFNQSLDSWNVSNVTNMHRMFRGAVSFNQPLNSWDVSSVTNMEWMFSSALAFNQPLNSWDVSSVTNMDFMFYATRVFNQSLNSWNVSHVTSMVRMLGNATSFNQPLDSWDVSSVINMSEMFRYADVFNQPLNSWNVLNVTNMYGMFGNAIAFNQPLDSWDVSSVTDMGIMFLSAVAFNQDISQWEVSNVVAHGSFAQNPPLENAHNPFYEEVVDSTKPVITLLGDATVSLTVGDTYTDAGATATDNIDGNITANIVTVNSVNTSIVGDYSVTYDVNDSAGNVADTITRTIHVVLASDTTSPIITVLGDVNISVIKGTSYTDAGATAIDDIDGDLSSEISIDNPVDTDADIGTEFVVTYSVFDNEGNRATATRNITIVRDLDISLTDWIANGDGTWVLQSDNKSVKQTRNGNPTIYHNNVNSQSDLFKLSGQITVQTRTDDDFIGFVLGYHDGDVDKDNVDYLLIDWKQGNQPDAIGDATRGLAISRVTKRLRNSAGAWIHSSEDGVTELQRATHFGHARWADNTTYTFEITFTRTLVEVFIDGVKELSVSGTFNDGSYGFYNYSQANVLYSAIEVSTDIRN